ncbi:MAG: hypothetical protein IJN25_07120 [Clostridia bacterium]|nr:hypothetical protein [Oscillospiraceae bacterium]MBQ7033410.1 hypothetical protein [Clostridia bacterium]
MKITFLGTAAAEGFPAVFCNCEYCREAKRLGGKNIRTRSQSIINDDLLIDLPADTYSHFLNNNIDGDAIKYLIVTHSHPDHFYEKELGMRHAPFAKNMRTQRLKIYCSEGAAKVIQEMYGNENYMLDCMALKPFDTVVAGNYEITALPARHFPGDGSLFYIITGEKTILYAHDTGYFYEEVFDYIKDSKHTFDLVSLDCTNVDIPASDEGYHMGIDNITRVLKRLEGIGAIHNKTQKVINHFSHNGNPIHHRLEERVKDYGYKVSYDGLCIEL